MSFKVKNLLLLLMIFPFADSECSKARKRGFFYFNLYSPDEKDSISQAIIFSIEYFVCTDSAFFSNDSDGIHLLFIPVKYAAHFIDSPAGLRLPDDIKTDFQTSKQSFIVHHSSGL